MYIWIGILTSSVLGFVVCNRLSWSAKSQRQMQKHHETEVLCILTAIVAAFGVLLS